VNKICSFYKRAGHVFFPSSEWAIIELWEDERMKKIEEKNEKNTLKVILAQVYSSKC